MKREHRNEYPFVSTVETKYRMIKKVSQGNLKDGNC